MRESEQLPTIGWREHVALPDWKIRGVRAKVDTGARISAIDVGAIEETADGRLRFEVVTRRKPARRARWIVAEPSRSALIKPSHGRAQERHVVTTRLRIGAHEHEIELSLVCRRGMLCRMLIGREALAGRFLVDSESRYLLSDQPGQRNRGDTE